MDNTENQMDLEEAVITTIGVLYHYKHVRNLAPENAKSACGVIVGNKENQAIAKILDELEKLQKQSIEQQRVYCKRCAEYSHYMRFESISKKKIEDKINKSKKLNEIKILKEILKESEE